MVLAGEFSVKSVGRERDGGGGAVARVLVYDVQQ